MMNNTRKLVEDYRSGVAEILNPQLQDLKRESDSRISLASEKGASKTGKSDRSINFDTIFFNLQWLKLRVTPNVPTQN